MPRSTPLPTNIHDFCNHVKDKKHSSNNESTDGRSLPALVMRAPLCSRTSVVHPLVFVSKEGPTTYYPRQKDGFLSPLQQVVDRSVAMPPPQVARCLVDADLQGPSAEEKRLHVACTTRQTAGLSESCCSWLCSPVQRDYRATEDDANKRETRSVESDEVECLVGGGSTVEEHVNLGGSSRKQRRYNHPAAEELVRVSEMG